jgi:hypothetical protein
LREIIAAWVEGFSLRHVCSVPFRHSAFEADRLSPAVFPRAFIVGREDGWAEIQSFKKAAQGRAGDGHKNPFSGSN